MIDKEMEILLHSGIFKKGYVSIIFHPKYVLPEQNLN